MIVSPLGGITVRIGTTPQGQGHRTVAAQVVADALGRAARGRRGPDRASTRRRAPGRVASGNYSSRFSGVGAAAVHLAAMKVAAKLQAIARPSSTATRTTSSSAEDKAWRGDASSRCDGSRASRTGTRTSLPPGLEPGLHETAFYGAPNLAAPDADDRVASSAAHGFVVDVAVVEVDRETGVIDVLDYVTVHDAGRLLNPLLVDGQVRGGFAHGAGAALLRAIVLRRGRQPAHGLLHGLRLPRRGRPAAAPDRPPLDAVAVHAARSEGTRRGKRR